MGMKDAAVKRYVIGPAIRQHSRRPVPRLRDADDLATLGIARQKLSPLASQLQGLLRQRGWALEPKLLNNLQLGTRIADLTRLIADHVMVSAPKTCRNGHPQSYPGQTVCDLDGLPFR